MSPKLSDAEQMLKDQYIELYDLKQELLKLKEYIKSSKKETQSKPSNTANQGNNKPRVSELGFRGAVTTNIKSITSAQAAANTANAKKLLASGAIKLNIEKKTSFKRSSNLKRRIKAEDSNMKKTRLNEKVNREASVEVKEDQKEFEENSINDEIQFKKQIQNRQNIQRNISTKPRKPQQRPGNTIYVYGNSITEQNIEKTFKRFGNIIDIKMKGTGKNSGFISFDTYEAAEKAINEADDLILDDCRIKVSLARHQPLRHVVEERWKELSHERSDKGSNDRDSRDLVTYEDDDFFTA